MFTALVRCWYQCSHATAMAKVDTSLFGQMKL